MQQRNPEVKSDSEVVTKMDIMRTITAFIKTHAVWTYYALTFAISWGVLVLAGLMRSKVQRS
jgi:hypothetical protein